MSWEAVTSMIVAVGAERGGYAGFRSWFGGRPAAAPGNEVHSIAAMVGYALDPSRNPLVELEPAKAMDTLAFFAADNMVMPTALLPSEEVLALLENGIARMGPAARFYSNGWQEGSRCGSWFGISKATFDGGLIGFNHEVGFIVWVEEED